MQRDATHYINKCQNCLKRKATPDVAPLQPIIANQPMELVHMDFLSIEPSKGNIENVLVITDHFTRYAQAYPSKTQTAQATAKLLWEILLDIMASQKSSCQIKEEILRVN